MLEGQLTIKLYDIIDNLQLLLGRLVLWVDFEGTLKLEFGALITADGSQYQTPYNPILSVLWVDLHSLTYLFDGFGHLSFFIECEGPVPVAVVIGLIISHFW